MGVNSMSRQCSRGHGPMVLMDGSYALLGVEPAPRQNLLAQMSTIYKPNGSLFALKLYRCAVCGLVELVDEV